MTALYADFTPVSSACASSSRVDRVVPVHAPRESSEYLGQDHARAGPCAPQHPDASWPRPGQNRCSLRRFPSRRRPWSCSCLSPCPRPAPEIRARYLFPLYSFEQCRPREDHLPKQRAVDHFVRQFIAHLLFHEGYTRIPFTVTFHLLTRIPVSSSTLNFTLSMMFFATAAIDTPYSIITIYLDDEYCSVRKRVRLAAPSPSGIRDPVGSRQRSHADDAVAFGRGISGNTCNHVVRNDYLPQRWSRLRPLFNLQFVTYCNNHNGIVL